MSRIQSNSSINTFKQCKKKYQYQYIIKPDVDETIPDYFIKGTQTHEAIANGETGTVELDYAKKFHTKGKKKKKGIITTESKRDFIEFTEHKFGITKDYKPTTFNDKKAVFRGVIDYARIYLSTDIAESDQSLNFEDCVESIEILDWKTGKPRFPKDQLELYSLFFFASYPKIDTVDCKIVNVTHQKSREWEITREKSVIILEKLQVDLDTISMAQEFPVSPSPLCGWCKYEEICKANQEKRNQPKQIGKGDLKSLFGVKD